LIASSWRSSNRQSVVRLVAVGFVLVAQLSDARADDTAKSLLRDADAAHAELRFDDALALLERAWHLGESNPEQVREIFARAGQDAGAMGDLDAAKLWFSRWLSVDPDASLPPGASPKVAAAFADARRGLGGGAISVRATVHGGDITFVLERDPLSLVAKTRIGETVQRARPGREVELSARKGAAEDDDENDEQIELLDRDGNVLLVVTPSKELPPAPIPLSAQPAWYARWPLWTGVTVGLAAISGVSFGFAVSARDEWRDLNDASSMHEYTEARAVERRFERTLLVSRITLVGAALTGVVGAIVVVSGREQAVSVTPTSSGAAVVWSGGF
jgi:hypothetical protein